jgi:hypothetical protein
VLKSRSAKNITPELSPIQNHMSRRWLQLKRSFSQVDFTILCPIPDFEGCDYQGGKNRRLQASGKICLSFNPGGSFKFPLNFVNATFPLETPQYEPAALPLPAGKICPSLWILPSPGLSISPYTA